MFLLKCYTVCGAGFLIRSRQSVSSSTRRRKLPARLLKDGVISLAQLHGQEDEAYIRKVRELSGISGGKIIKAFSVKRREDVEKAFGCSADMVLLDHGKAVRERTLTGACWKTGAHERKEEKPFFLAGGLSPENIPEAVRRCRPYGVDLSSAVETDGRKDREKNIGSGSCGKEYGEMKKGRYGIHGGQYIPEDTDECGDGAGGSL